MARKTTGKAEQSGGETPERDTESDLKLTEYHNKRVAFYENWTKAWIDNRTERNKQSLIVSYLSIGVLVTAFDIPTEMPKLMVWVVTFVSFAICIFCIFRIFPRNANYIDTLLVLHEAEDRGTEGEEEAGVLRAEARQKAKILSILTKVVSLCFTAGMILGIVFIGIDSLYPILTKG